MFTEERPLPSFSEIVFNGDYVIYLYQGDTPSVKILSSKDIAKKVRTKVRRNRLRIFRGFDPRFWLWGSYDLEVHVTVTNLRSVKMNGSGDILGGSPLLANQLKIVNTGTGSLDLAFEVGELTLKASGMGPTYMAGKAGNLVVKANGTGSIDASQLAVKDAQLHCNGIGNVKVDVSDTLEVRLNGIGSVIYSGEPVIKKKGTGLGNIRRAGSQSFLEESINKIFGEGTLEFPVQEQQKEQEENLLS